VSQCSLLNVTDIDQDRLAAGRAPERPPTTTARRSGSFFRSLSVAVWFRAEKDVYNRLIGAEASILLKAISRPPVSASRSPHSPQGDWACAPSRLEKRCKLPKQLTLKHFYRAMLCIIVANAVVRCLHHWVSVCHVRVLGRNSYRYGHSCYGMRIGNRIQAFEWYHFQ